MANIIILYELQVSMIIFNRSAKSKKEESLIFLFILRFFPFFHKITIKVIYNDHSTNKIQNTIGQDVTLENQNKIYGRKVLTVWAFWNICPVLQFLDS